LLDRGAAVLSVLSLIADRWLPLASRVPLPRAQPSHQVRVVVRKAVVAPIKRVGVVIRNAVAGPGAAPAPAPMAGVDVAERYGTR